MVDYKCRNTSREGVTWSRTVTLVILSRPHCYTLKSPIQYFRDVEDGVRGPREQTPLRRRYETPTCTSGHLSGSTIDYGGRLSKGSNGRCDHSV